MSTSTGIRETSVTCPRHLGGGRYRLEHELARGGFGRVYRATQLELGRDVALKILDIDPSTDPRAASRFLAEAALTARLDHPHIVTVLDAGEEGGVPWIAYELLPGRTLLDRMHEGPLSWEEAQSVVIQVTQALGAAHERGIVHRDLKAENILEVHQGHYKLVDFGLATGPGFRSHTKSGVLVGTPLYIAPERLRGHEAGPAADFYALGILLHEMLTGNPPMNAEDMAGIVHWHLEGDLPSLRWSRPDLPPVAGRLLAALLQKDPELRAASARDVEDMLTEAQRLADRAHATGPTRDARSTLRSGDSNPRHRRNPAAQRAGRIPLFSRARTTLPVAAPRSHGFSIPLFLGMLMLLVLGASLSAVRAEPPLPDDLARRIMMDDIRRSSSTD